MDMSMLPHDQRIFLEIGYVIERRLWPELEQEPANVGVEKSFGDVVRVLVVIDMFMVPAMFARPEQNGVLESARAENECEQTHGQFCSEGHVRKQPVITERNAETGRGQ